MQILSNFDFFSLSLSLSWNLRVSFMTCMFIFWRWILVEVICLTEQFCVWAARCVIIKIRGIYRWNTGAPLCMEVAEQFFTQTSNTTRWCPSVLLKNIAHYHPKTDSLVKYLIDRQGSLLSWTYLKIELHTTKTSTPPPYKFFFSPTLSTYLWFWAIIVSVCNCDNYYFNMHKRRKFKIFI